jgi:hypothetical protein
MNNFLSSVWVGLKKAALFFVSFSLISGIAYLTTNHFSWQDVTLGSAVLWILAYAKEHLVLAGVIARK